MAFETHEKTEEWTHIGPFRCEITLEKEEVKKPKSLFYKLWQKVRRRG